MDRAAQASRVMFKKLDPRIGQGGYSRIAGSQLRLISAVVVPPELAVLTPVVVDFRAFCTRNNPCAKC